MRIRCERCSTVYELDPARLSSGGTPVQCTRCRHVFQAFPTADGGGPGGGAERPETTEVFASAERTSQYPAPAPAPSRVRPPPAQGAARLPGPGRAPVAPRPEGVLGWSRTTWFLVGGLVVAILAAAAWMALWGGRGS